MQYHITKTDEGERFITMFIPGQKPLVAHDTHANWDNIVQGALAEDESVYDLFDIALTAGMKFESLSDRVSVAKGRVFLDGVEMNSALTSQIVEFVREGKNFKPLVNFYEKIDTNPNEHAKEHLYKFIQVNQDSETGAFTITDDGNFIAYKGVESDGNGGYQSTWTGNEEVIVDNEVVVGKVPNKLGSVVQMPRDKVDFNPDAHCSVGLHVGTFPYAESYSGNDGAMLKVLVNPRDVISVPNDSDEKMRVCRYKVIEIIEAPETSAVVDAVDEETDLDNDIRVGDVFVDTDKRRQSEKKVVEIRDNTVLVESKNKLGLKRKREIGKFRLLSRKYKRVRRGRKS